MKARILNDTGYFDLRALAEYSCCSVRWLRSRLIDQIQPLPHYRVEGKILVKREEFDQWMMTHRAMQPANDVAEFVESIVFQMKKPRPRA